MPSGDAETRRNLPKRVDDARRIRVPVRRTHPPSPAPNCCPERPPWSRVPSNVRGRGLPQPSNPPHRRQHTPLPPSRPVRAGATVKARCSRASTCAYMTAKRLRRARTRPRQTCKAGRRARRSRAAVLIGSSSFQEYLVFQPMEAITGTRIREICVEMQSLLHECESITQEVRCRRREGRPRGLGHRAASPAGRDRCDMGNGRSRCPVVLRRTWRAAYSRGDDRVLCRWQLGDSGLVR